MRASSLTVLFACLALAGSPALSQGQPQQGAAVEEGPGFRVEIQGVPASMDRDSFIKAVIAALPAPLLDPSQNFTRAEIYDPEQDYRLLMVFHAPGSEVPDMDQLCNRVDGPPVPGAEPPEFADLGTTTKIAAAFCRGRETLNTASDQMTGQVTPDQASFRFLVADVAKQLFPSGFGTMPGTPGALVAPPPG